MNISRRITLWALVASILVLVPTEYFAYQSMFEVYRRQIAVIQPLFAENIETNIVRQCRTIEMVTHFLARDIESGSGETLEDATKLFERCLNASEDRGAILGLILAREHEGTGMPEEALYVHRNLDDPGAAPLRVDLLKSSSSQALMARNWYRVTKETLRPSWTPPYRGFTTGKPMLTYSVPLFDRAGKFFGVVACDVTLEWLDAFIEKIALPNTDIDQIFVLAGDGTVIADKQWEMIDLNILDTAAEREDVRLGEIARDMLDGGKEVVDYHSPDGRWVGKIAYMPIDDGDGDNSTGWSLGIFISADTIRANARNLLGTQVLIGIVGVVLLVLAFRFVAREISRPIRQLQEAALRISTDNLDMAVPKMRWNDEVSDLAESFAQMQEKLRSSIRSLERTTRLKEQMESELRIGRKIQMSLVPTHIPEGPFRDRFDLAAFMEPALQVGGDFYDYFLLDDDRLCLVIADVSGKGVPAALQMSRVSALFRSFLVKDRQLGLALRQINEETCRDNENCMFITLFALEVRLSDGRTRCVNAGHNPPILLRNGEKPEMLELAANLPLGLDPGCDYPETRWQFRSGDLLFLYTDGVTEAHDPDSRLLGENRTREALPRSVETPCEEVLQKVRETILAFIKDTPQSDDITMLAFRWK